MIEGLRYNLRMMGVPIDGACEMFCDNDSVVKNISRLVSSRESVEEEVEFHFFRKARESIDGGWVKLTKELGDTHGI